MPIEVVRVERTPNPNARKFVTRTEPAMQIRSFFSADAAADDPLGARLFSIPGVTNVLIHAGFVSICKSPETKWASVEKAVTEVLRGA
ncbi:MAG: NifU N-terminal domain-containing protein [Phycisphaerales bacterium]|nr:NifU N-terminal domain-containing protein [Phycisphaerales bacterium]